MKKIPEGFFEIPLEEVDYIYQSSQSHTPIVVMKQKLSPMQPEKFVCMKCGSEENLNMNKDKSFVECDKCMWKKEEEWRDMLGNFIEDIDKRKEAEIFIEQLVFEKTMDAQQELIDNIWDEAFRLASRGRHNKVIPESQVNSNLAEAIKNIGDDLSKFLGEEE